MFHRLYSDNSIKRYNSVFIFIIFGISMYLGKLRVLLFDGTDYTLAVINKSWFHASNGRYIDFVTEIIPVILLKLHAPLNMIIWGFALNYAVVPVITFFIIRLLLNDLKAEIAFLTGFSLLYTFCFISPYYEVFTGTCAMYLLYGCLSDSNGILSKKPLYQQRLILLIIILSILFSHLSLLFPTLSLFFYIFFLGTNKKNALFSFLALIFLLPFKLFIFSSPYEHSRLKEVFQAGISGLIQKYLSNFMIFFHSLPHHNLNVVVVFLSVLLILIIQREYKKIFFFIAATGFQLSFIFIVVPLLKYGFCNEMNFKTAFFFLSIIFAETFITSKTFLKKIFLLIYLFSCLYWTIGTFHTSRIYSEYYAAVKELITKTEKKGISTRNIIYTRKPIPSYRYEFLGFETLLISSIDKPYSTFSMLTSDSSFVRYIERGNSNDTLFLQQDYTLPMHFINRRYVGIQAERYNIINGDSLNLALIENEDKLCGWLNVP